MKPVFRLISKVELLGFAALLAFFVYFLFVVDVADARKSGRTGGGYKSPSQNASIRYSKRTENFKRLTRASLVVPTALSGTLLASKLVDSANAQNILSLRMLSENYFSYSVDNVSLVKKSKNQEIAVHTEPVSHPGRRNLRKATQSSKTYPKDLDVRIISLLPRNGLEFEGVFEGSKPSQSQLNSMSNARKDFERKHTSAVADVVSKSEFDKQFHSAVKSGSHFVFIIGHSRGGHLRTADGQKIRIEEISKRCMGSLIVCVFLSCNSLDFVGQKAFGVKNPIEVREAWGMLDNAMSAIAQSRAWLKDLNSAPFQKRESNTIELPEMSVPRGLRFNPLRPEDLSSLLNSGSAPMVKGKSSSRDPRWPRLAYLSKYKLFEQYSLAQLEGAKFDTFIGFPEKRAEISRFYPVKPEHLNDLKYLELLREEMEFRKSIYNIEFRKNSIDIQDQIYSDLSKNIRLILHGESFNFRFDGIRLQQNNLNSRFDEVFFYSYRVGEDDGTEHRFYCYYFGLLC